MQTCYEKDDFYLRITSAELNHSGEVIVDFPQHFVQQHHIRSAALGNRSVGNADFSFDYVGSCEDWKVALTRVGIEFYLEQSEASLKTIDEVLLCADFCEQTALVCGLKPWTQPASGEVDSSMMQQNRICFVPLLRTLGCEALPEDLPQHSDNAVGFRVPIHDCLRLLYPDVVGRGLQDVAYLKLYLRRANGAHLALAAGTLTCELHFLKC